MATPIPSDRRYTVADYLALDDDERYELVDGRLAMAPAPSTRHQGILLALASAMRAHAVAGGLGKVFIAPVDVVLSNVTVLQPDLLFVSAERWPEVDDGHRVVGPPDMALEVLSPSNMAHDRTTERDVYLRAGVPWLVLVDPAARVVEVFRLADGAYVLESNLANGDVLTLDAVLPGFEVELVSVWFE